MPILLFSNPLQELGSFASESSPGTRWVRYNRPGKPPMISDSTGALRSGSHMVYAADIGSTRCKAGGIPNFGWVKVDPADPASLRGSSDIGILAEQIIADLKGGRDVALGFEAPLFILCLQSPPRFATAERTTGTGPVRRQRV